jgi:hypothetical protein
MSLLQVPTEPALVRKGECRRVWLVAREKRGSGASNRSLTDEPAAKEGIRGRRGAGAEMP